MFDLAVHAGEIDHNLFTDKESLSQTKNNDLFNNEISSNQRTERSMHRNSMRRLLCAQNDAIYRGQQLYYDQNKNRINTHIIDHIKRTDKFHIQLRRGHARCTKERKISFQKIRLITSSKNNKYIYF